MSKPERKVVVVADPVETAAAIFSSTAIDAIARRGRFLTALSGGSTPKRLFERLTAAPYREAIDWGKVYFLWGDERSVPPEDAESNFAMAKKHLLDPLKIPAANIQRMEAERPDIDAAAAEYELNLRTLMLEQSRSDKLDLVLLGMGADGHTASLFPGTTALAETNRWVVANEVPQLKTWRMTLTYPAINAARKVLFLVSGGDKAATIKEVLTGPPNAARFPSQAVAAKEGETIWVLDQAAGAGLAK
jgi:6-phosphogluconolactonase